MSSYRFCRTDDIGLLVDALNRCWAPYAPAEPLATPASFKRSIRDLQVWCSSCMVAFEGADPIAVLIGAKRGEATLVHRIAVHPDHLRQGHGRHLLESLSSKLAILGPPRLVAEVPEPFMAACALFRERGFEQGAQLTDYVRHGNGHEAGAVAGTYVLPLTVDDLAGNGLAPHPDACWERSIETLRARKDDILGLGLASDERIEAYLLYRRLVDEPWTEIAAIGSVDDGGARVGYLLAQLQRQGVERIRIPKVHAREFSPKVLEDLGFEPAVRYRQFHGTAREH